MAFMYLILGLLLNPLQYLLIDAAAKVGDASQDLRE
jgi:hypothetical protein